MQRLSDVRKIAERNGLTIGQTLRVLNKTTWRCPSCHKWALIDYYHSNGVVSACLLCDYEIE